MNLTVNWIDNILTRPGTQFGSDSDNIMNMTREIYELKSICAAFRFFIVDTHHGMGYEQYWYDNSMWTNPVVKYDGF